METVHPGFMSMIGSNIGELEEMDGWSVRYAFFKLGLGHSVVIFG